jgi:acetyl-CoA acetyltransferase
MHLYGTTSKHLGAVAVTQRNYASVRPEALGYGKPITLEEHQASPMIADPFRRLDCTRDTDGGCAVLVTTAARARAMQAGTAKAKPVYVMGAGLGHNIVNWHQGLVYENHDNIAPAKARAFKQAGMTLDDIHMAQLDDPFTISPLMQLEAYGFVREGQGGPFYADGGAGPDGKIPTNTGGGQLSAASVNADASSTRATVTFEARRISPLTIRDTVETESPARAATVASETSSDIGLRGVWSGRLFIVTCNARGRALSTGPEDDINRLLTDWQTFA